MPWDRVHDEAEVLEHYISEELEERIAAALGDPSHDPHGDPIPDRGLAARGEPRRAAGRARAGRAASSRGSRTRPGDAPLPGRARDPPGARGDGQRARALRRLVSIVVDGGRTRSAPSWLGGWWSQPRRDSLRLVALADDFQEILDSLPDDWTDLTLDLRLPDEERYVDAAVLLTQVNAQPYSRPTGTGGSTSPTSSATRPRRRPSRGRSRCSTRRASRASWSSATSVRAGPRSCRCGAGPSRCAASSARAAASGRARTLRQLAIRRGSTARASTASGERVGVGQGLHLGLQRPPVRGPGWASRLSSAASGSSAASR